VYRRIDTNLVAVGGATSTSVYCEPGESVLGGAAAWARQAGGLVESNATVSAAAPTDGGGTSMIDLTADQGQAVGYVFAGRNTSSGMAKLVGYVICAKP
jgi:hypothetical protein